MQQWRQSFGFVVCAAVYFCFFMPSSFADDSTAATPREQLEAAETIQVIVTTDKITIDTNYAGSKLYIAGVVENSDPQLMRQNRYDVIVALEGPRRAMVMWEKKRKAGVWVNADSLVFKSAPLYYALASTRQLQDITTPINYQSLGLGLQYVPLRTDSADEQRNLLFRDKFLMAKMGQNLFSQNVATVVFSKGSLFTTQFLLPANVPVGQYQVKAYLFRDSHFVQSASSDLAIVKAHFAYSLYHMAHTHSFLYGVLAILVAVITGVAGRFVFRKD